MYGKLIPLIFKRLNYIYFCLIDITVIDLTIIDVMVCLYYLNRTHTCVTAFVVTVVYVYVNTFYLLLLINFVAVISVTVRDFHVQPLIAVLRDRLFQSLGQNPVNVKAPPRPFKVIDVKPERQRQPSQPTQPVQPRSRTSSANYTVT